MTVNKNLPGTLEDKGHMTKNQEKIQSIEMDPQMKLIFELDKKNLSKCDSYAKIIR